MRTTDDPIPTKKTRMNIVGKTFGRLSVIEYAYTNKHGQSMWKCKCECGKEIVVTGIHLKSGHTVSCGCKKDEVVGNRSRKHGMRHTRIYRIWLDMKSRCAYKTVPSFRWYGGRGITVCEEWRNSFEAFYDWAMANGYTDELTIDRIDVNGNYEPSNCRWATSEEQRLNTSANRRITFNGETHTLSEWAQITGIHYNTIYSRFAAGKSPSEILKRKEAQQCL